MRKTKLLRLNLKLYIMKNIFCLLAALIICSSAFCNSADTTVKSVKIKRYHVNYPVVGSIIGVGMIGDFFAIHRLKNKATITDEELLFANTDQQKKLINSIDRWALKQNPSDRALWKGVSDYGQIGIFLLPTLLLIDKPIRKDWFDLLLMYVEGHTITFTFYNYSCLGPTFVNRYRPAVYYSELSTKDRENSNNRNSFYSGHVASCAYSTFFMAKVYCDYHPNIGAGKYLLYLAASVPPLIMGYARIGALAHFPSDGVVGFALGAIIGIVVPELHKNRKYDQLSFGMFTSPDSMGLSICWKLQNKRQITPDK
jgi:membrane-associated phospholipid phosphatase